MRIIHFSTPLSWRGGERQLAFLLEELNLRGINQMVVCSKGSAMESYCKSNRIDVTTLPKSSSISLFNAYRFSKICKRSVVDLIHAHDSHAHTIALNASVFFNNQTPVVLSRKVDFPVGENWLSKFKYNHSCVYKIICVSAEIKKILNAVIKDKDKLKVVHDGVNLSGFSKAASGILRKEYKIRNDELLIGNIAAIAPHKDYYTFVDTAKILIEKGVKAKFMIIGEGSEKESITNYVQGANINDHIIFTGFRKDIPEILPELDVFLFTSKTEGLGSSILDAYLCGVPVISTDAGGIPEIIIDGETGLLSPVKNALHLAENVLRMIKDDQLKAKLTKNAKQYVLGYSKEIMAQKTLDVYLEVLSEK
jgi:L-malate glycosyltransferase